ncbi:glycosyltransferase family 1 protein [Chryseobacterium sp. SC28]|uniref:glycosyltransferase family 1 protein n=1 Tax=Chryseobacterium sp. SC28 TaxID=2268028 RepID=UPI000F654BB9|nr:glycosyltransferase family 1 protein [Chryseobacterium sp. SC28]RRQ45859.1 glycosyltransferase family 1 protein [Chryseobacterium sp. SC28]
MKKIKVLHVLTVLDRGGLETMLMNYFRNLDRTIFEFQFLVHRESGAYEKEILQKNGTIHRVPPLNFSVRNFLKYQKELDVFFQNNKFDVIHVHNNSFGYYPLKYAKKHRIPVRIIHSHISSLTDDRKKILLGKYLNKKIPKVATQLFACGREAGKWMYGNNTFEVIPNAIDSQLFSYNIKVRNQAQMALNCQDKINIINVARFNKQKNHLFLLEIFAELLKLSANYHLYLVGDGDLKPDIMGKITELGIGEQVTLLGVRGDVAELLQAMDVFLLPSLFEGLPVSLIEAQASGIRCVISDGVPKEAILVEDNVKVIPLKKSAADWAAEIKEFSAYDRKDVSEVIKARGYDIVENARSLERKYLELLQKNS